LNPHLSGYPRTRLSIDPALSIAMSKLLAGLQFFQRVPRVVAYALLAALVTTALFAADGAYRWYQDRTTPVAAQEPREPSVKAPEPLPVETRHTTAASQPLTTSPEPAIVATEKPAEDRVAAEPVPNPTSGSIPNPAAAPAPSMASAPVPTQAAPQRTRPELSPQPKRQQVRRPPAKKEARDRAASRRQLPAEKPSARAAKPSAPAEKPNVYYERDTQLGFAPQLRKRTCNPATGNMPMQCYYPREGRERFPSKPIDE